MHLNTWNEFRHDLYDHCLLRAKDALFNTVDALMTETQAKSLPEVTQSLWFERTWSSIYEAFEDGRIDQQALRRVFLQYLPADYLGNSLWIGIDTTGIARPKAKSARDRSALPVHNLPACEKPVTWGWQFSTVVALPDPASSWTYLLDQQRVDTETTAVQLAFAQLQPLAESLPKETVVVLDRGYNAIWLWCQCSTLPITGTLVRLKSNHCFYRVAPPKSRKRGAPRKDGAKLQPDDETTQGDLDGTWEGQDAKGRPVTISWWKQVHVKQARWLGVTVLRVVRPQAAKTERDPRVSWFVWIGGEAVDLASIALEYVRRFGQEHGYRFDKQALLWEKARLRTPEQFERWSLVVAMVHNQVVLARAVVEPKLRPWENRQRVPTPQQVRRGIGQFLPRLGTPARPPLRKIPGDLLIIWDGSPIHRANVVKAFLTSEQGKWVHLEPLPGYAPELNPQEQVWNLLKRRELKNLCCRDLTMLRQELVRAKERLRHRRPTLQHCFTHALAGV